MKPFGGKTGDCVGAAAVLIIKPCSVQRFLVFLAENSFQETWLLVGCI